MYSSYSQLGSNPEQPQDQYDVLEIVNPGQKNQILQSNRIVCVDVYATWCQPCKQSDGPYSMLASKYNRKGECLLVKENYENKLSQGVHVLPTYLFYVNGNKVDEVVGADMGKIEAVLEKLMTDTMTPNRARNTIRNTKPANAVNPYAAHPGVPNQSQPFHTPYQQGDFGSPSLK